MLHRIPFPTMPACLCGRRKPNSPTSANCATNLKHLIQELRHYNEHHDSILKVIVDSLQRQCPPDYKITADLPWLSVPYQQSLHRPASRPGDVEWPPVDPGACWTNVADASQRKKHKYQDLLKTCTANGYNTHLVTLEVGNVASYVYVM